MDGALLDDFLDALAQAGVRVAPLDQVLADEVYARPDVYVGGAMTWLGRFEPAMAGETWFSAEERRVARRWQPRLDALDAR